MSSVAAGYLPILLFLGVALALSGAFVVLPMIVSRFTGSHENGAQISVDSTVGQGSRFTVRLPHAEPGLEASHVRH